MIVALAQLSSQDSWNDNLKRVLSWIEVAANESAAVVMFPENTLYMGDPDKIRKVALEIQSARAISQIQQHAKQHNIAVLVGGYPELRPRSQKLFNTSLFLDEKGQQLAKYRKMHLFDVVTPSGERYAESKRFAPGTKLVTFKWQGIRIGLSICFDLRFPEQYRSLAKLGAEWLLVPSAFTQETGAAHWHTLLRARAIENLAIVIAPAQTGTHPGGRKTFGHSLVVGPWGDVLLDGKDSSGLKIVDLSLDQVRSLRKKFTLLKINR